MSTPAAAIAPRRSRRLLAPLATLAVAGALVVGSGADFVSTSANAQSVVASGTLTQSNSRADQAIFNVSNVKPGDTVTGQLKIRNTGSLPATFTVAETATNGFSTGSLSMTVTETKGTTTSVVYSGAFGGFATKSLGLFAAAEERTFDWTVTLAQSATNADQGKSATASYVWNSTQTTAVTVDQRAAVNPVPQANANP